MIAEEEARAALYRAQLAARAVNERARLRSLAGNPAAAAAVKAAWQPFLDAQRDPDGTLRLDSRSSRGIAGQLAGVVDRCYEMRAPGRRYP